jgi:hypothetical protein
MNEVDAGQEDSGREEGGGGELRKRIKNTCLRSREVSASRRFAVIFAITVALSNSSQRGRRNVNS